MIEQYASSSCLSCLVNSVKELEHLPEPFRMQHNVTFRVTLSTYTEFILSITPNTGVRLMTQLGTLQQLASVRSPRLYNYFLADISFAILKEISYAENYDRYATVILPTAQNAKNVAVSYLMDMYNSVSYGVEDELRRFVLMCGYTLPIKVSTRNTDLYRTAIVLYNLSKCTTAVKEVNLLYDCTREFRHTV